MTLQNDLSGDNCLHIAVQNKDITTIAFLLKKYAEPNTKNLYNQTALDMANAEVPKDEEVPVPDVVVKMIALLSNQTEEGVLLALRPPKPVCCAESEPSDTFMPPDTYNFYFHFTEH